MGVHYRFDSTEGLILGETAAIRMLHQVMNTCVYTPVSNVMKFACVSRLRASLRLTYRSTHISASRVECAQSSGMTPHILLFSDWIERLRE